MKLAILAGAMLAALLSASNARAVPPQPIAAPPDAQGHPRMGTWLEGQFQKMVESCIGESLTLRTKDNKSVPASAIPSFVRTTESLGDGGPPIALFAAETLSRHFGYVFKDGESISSPRGPNYLDIPYDNELDQVTARGVSGSSYYQTCASSLSAALEADATFSAPLATFKAVLKSDYDNDRSFSLRFAKGRFESPIWGMYNGEAWANGTTESFYAAMLVWDWYRDHPDRMRVRNLLLRSFDGVSLYRQIGGKTKTTVSGGGSAGGGLLFFTASARTDASLQLSTEARADSFATAVVFQNTTPVWTFQDLPTPEAVADKASRAATVGFDSNLSSDLTLWDEQPKTVVHRVRNMPRKLCVPDAWSAAGSGVRLVDAAPADATKTIGECVFTTKFTLPAGTNLAADYTLDLTLNSSAGAAAQRTTLSLHPQPVQLSGNTLPVLTAMGGYVDAKIGQLIQDGDGVVTEVNWELPYQLTVRNTAKDRDLVASGSDVEFLNMRFVDCGEVTLNPDNVRLDLEATSGTVKRGRLLFSTRVRGDLKKGPMPAQSCTIAGDVKYTLTVNRTLTRKMQATIRYPRLNAQPARATPTAATTAAPPPTSPPATPPPSTS